MPRTYPQALYFYDKPYPLVDVIENVQTVLNSSGICTLEGRGHYRANLRISLYPTKCTLLSEAQQISITRQSLATPDNVFAKRRFTVPVPEVSSITHSTSDVLPSIDKYATLFVFEEYVSILFMRRNFNTRVVTHVYLYVQNNLLNIDYPTGTGTHCFPITQYPADADAMRRALRTSELHVDIRAIDGMSSHKVLTVTCPEFNYKHLVLTA